LEYLLAHYVVVNQTEYAKVTGPPELAEVDGSLSGLCLPLTERMFIYELGLSNSHLAGTE